MSENHDGGGAHGPTPEGDGPKLFKEAFPHLNSQDARKVGELMGMPLFSAYTAAMNLHGILGNMMHEGGDSKSVQAALGEAGTVFSSINQQFGNLGYTAEQVSAGAEVQRGNVILPPSDPQ